MSQVESDSDSTNTCTSCESVHCMACLLVGNSCLGEEKTGSLLEVSIYLGAMIWIGILVIPAPLVEVPPLLDAISVRSLIVVRLICPAMWVDSDAFSRWRRNLLPFVSTDTSEDYCALIVPKFTFGEAPFYVGFPLRTAPGTTCWPVIEFLLVPTASTRLHIVVILHDMGHTALGSFCVSDGTHYGADSSRELDHIKQINWL